MPRDERPRPDELTRRVPLLGRDRALEVLKRQRQPRGDLGVGKAPLREVMTPRHRRPAAISAFEFWPKRDAIRVNEGLEGELRLAQPKLFALIDAGSALEAQEHRHRGRGDRASRLRIITQA